MNVGERASWYAEQTGLSRAKVHRYRKQLVGEWTTDADRKIGSTIRFLERLAGDEELSWEDWEAQAKRLLDVIAQFVRNAFETIRDFVTQIANAAARVIEVLAKLLQSLEPFLQLLLPLVPHARKLIGV